MKRGWLLGAVLVAGCAHGGKGAAVHSRPHAPLTLVAVTGLLETEEPVLEGAICQGLVEGNGGDVACPDSTRQALEVARMRSLATSDSAQADATLAEVQRATAQVLAVVSREGESYVLSLQYRPRPDAPPSAQRTFKASSFEALVEGSTGEARALLE